MVVAASETGTAAAAILHAPRTETPWGFRFEAARALGHLLLDPARWGVIGAASSHYALQARRRQSGAFAAELLLPESALVTASKSTLDGALDERVFRQMLDLYGVGARTAAHQLWNRGLLSSESVRDDLIERFARHSN